MINKFDNKQTYCKQLGHEVAFKYCRLVHNELPCHQVFNCWFELFPVKKFIFSMYSKEDIKSILAPPPTRLENILTIAEKIYEQQNKTDE